MLKLPPHLKSVDGGQSTAGPTLADAAKPAAPEKPASLPAAVSEAWDVIVPALDEVGVLARCDGPALELALRHYVTAVAASDDVVAEPRLWDEKNGRPMKNPSSQVFRDHSTAFLEYAKQLGLTFVSRARAPKPDEGAGGADNPFAALG
ncbi:phage terminase small subunit P27 family [Streptomyces sp. DSM 44915]|uniref:Phage terminase small subunit P27 family n=1 Tax=Streptomyces chisholmiae TaxID=3075540 RepID=A0ABU2JZZ4_9ACTN|nr:phage terminase small subunit P27 family [Streptomyces sp. DSM 44915]MDT0270573.1 phage terminase small subunit P27 family [Streptomyces sp. DSM 44915]